MGGHQASPGVRGVAHQQDDEWAADLGDRRSGSQVSDSCDNLKEEAQSMVALYRNCNVPSEVRQSSDPDAAAKWWRQHKMHFPIVADLARRRLASQPSSATSERSFSKSGNIVTKRRVMLLPRHVDDLSLLAWTTQASTVEVRFCTKQTSLFSKYHIYLSSCHVTVVIL